jgi:hypothetical protein
VAFLYHFFYALRSTLYALRSTLYALRSTLYALRSTLYKRSGLHSLVSSPWYTFSMRKILTSLVLILGTYLISRYIFEPANLYYELPWLDIPMHIIGGYLVTYFFIACAWYYKIPFQYTAFIVSLSVVMILWEIYEYMRGAVLYDMTSDYVDSLKDIAIGFIGGYIAYKRN